MPVMYSAADLHALRESPLSQVWPTALTRAHLDEGFFNHERWSKRNLRGFLIKFLVRVLGGSRERGGQTEINSPRPAEGLGEVGVGPGIGEGGRVCLIEGNSIKTVYGRGRYGGSRGPYHTRGGRTRCLRAVARSGPHGSSCNLGGLGSQGLGFRLMLCNARSTVNKAPLIYDLVSEGEVDLAGITETWLGQEGGCPSLKCARQVTVHFTSREPRVGVGGWRLLLGKAWIQGRPLCRRLPVVNP